MTSKIIAGLIALGVFGAVGLAVQPVVAEPQMTIEDVRQEIRALEARVARLEKETRPRFQPAN